MPYAMIILEVVSLQKKADTMGMADFLLLDFVDIFNFPIDLTACLVAFLKNKIHFRSFA